MNAYLYVMPVRSKQVMLCYRVDTQYSRTYMLLCSRIYRLVPGTWYREPVFVPACNPSDAWRNQRTYYHKAPRTSNGFKRRQRLMDGIMKGIRRRHHGRNRFHVDGVRGPNLNAHTPIHTNNFSL